MPASVSNTPSACNKQQHAATNRKQEKAKENSDTNTDTKDTQQLSKDNGGSQTYNESGIQQRKQHRKQRRRQTPCTSEQGGRDDDTKV